ncbi:hypothetical protein ACVGVM_19140 [Pseudonocardia bannensis]|uniref:Uncharacterized protein n=1 Tax=Pseudonocardia bannensis TaxID=630973 RepID=A0A848DQI1_9PSEU|nr:hypothetical protein [Pseudonocardia bannensis]NMH94805.1 hypothetical protein [Pseudonocardia bannensis]
MAAQHVEIAAGGNADWSTPVRVDDSLLQASYQGIFMVRFAFADGRSHYLKMRIVGVDEMDNDGEVPSGFGALEFQDADGHRLRGRTDWYRADGADRGTWSFNSGTGKWEGASGKVEMLLNYMADDLDAELPPKGPIRFVGFIEGAGEIDAPGLSR